jgi:hypothetical protein
MPINLAAYSPKMAGIIADRDILAPYTGAPATTQPVGNPIPVVSNTNVPAVNQAALDAWYMGVVNAMLPNITQSDNRAAINAAATPKDKYDAAMRISPPHSDQYALYQAFINSNPMPTATSHPATPAPTTPTPTTPPPPPPPPPPVPTPTPQPIPGANPATPNKPPVDPNAPPKPGTKEYYLQQVNQTFAPGFEYGAAPSSLLDDVIAEILAEQQGAASEYLDRGKARGIYNDVGYNAGLEAMGDYAETGSSDLTTLGASALDKYRSQMSALATNAYNSASAFSPGLSFSLDPYMSEFNAIKNRAATNIEGDLRGLLGGKNYFDFSNLTSKAGQAQGALNLRDTDVATALAERARKNSIARGLGSQGAF